MVKQIIMGSINDENGVLYKIRKIDHEAKVYDKVRKVLSESGLSYYEVLGLLDFIKHDIMEEADNE